ncbi:hypothetical protein [Cupriavidus campinensis]
MHDYICPGLVTRVFPSLQPQDAGEVHVTEAVCVDDGMEVTGIRLADMRFVMFFADVSGDPAVNLRIPAGARFVTVVRIEADHGTMFLPDFWRLPQPHMVWQLTEALRRAVRHHVDTHPWVPQYVYVSQTRKMDFLCERVVRQLGRLGVPARFGSVIRPEAGKEGIHGFARDESCPA